MSGRFYLSVRDLADDEGALPIFGSTDPSVIQAAVDALADRLRERAVEKLGPSAGAVLDLARKRRESDR